MHIMLDIETLGKSEDAVILEITAVYFKINSINQRFHQKIKVFDQLCNRSIDPDTIKWWQNQVFTPTLDGSCSLEEALILLNKWWPDAQTVWANSPSFDCNILEHAYKQYGLQCPWSYRQERDLRTLKWLANDPKVESEGQEHNALDDCLYQIRLWQKCMEKICKQ